MSKKTTILISSLIVIVVLALASFWVVRNINKGGQDVNQSQNQNINKNTNQNANNNENINNSTEEVNYYEIIEPKKTDCVDNLDTACWQIFRNTEYNFEVMVPSDWIIDDQAKSYAVIVKKKSEEFYLIRINLGINQNKENKKIEDLCESDFGEEVLSCEDITINGYTFKKQIILDMGECTVYKTIKDNYIFSFVGYPFGERQEHKKIINKILSTLKFLD